jgi:hypothetical protein
MKQGSQGGGWVWVTHFLAIFFAVACMGIVIYSIVKVSDISVAKATMGFSSAILGVILGFYFNREQLTKESKERDYFSTQADVIHSEYIKLRTLLESLHSEIEEEVAE